MRLLLPTGGEGEPDLDALYAYPDDRPWLRANMVSSLDGAATAGGLSGGLGGPADRRVFAVLRGLADVVLVGTGTARVEGYRAATPKPAYAARRAALGQPPAPHLAVVTRSLTLDLAGPLFGGVVPTYVLTSRAADPARIAAAERVGHVVVCGDDDVDVTAAVAALHAAGLRRLLCEGGPTLLAQVAGADRLDELCLTLAPRLVGGDAGRIMHGVALTTTMRLVQLLEDDGFLFGRWVRG